MKRLFFSYQGQPVPVFMCYIPFNKLTDETLITLCLLAFLYILPACFMPKVSRLSSINEIHWTVCFGPSSTIIKHCSLIIRIRQMYSFYKPENFKFPFPHVRTFDCVFLYFLHTSQSLSISLSVFLPSICLNIRSFFFCLYLMVSFFTEQRDSTNGFFVFKILVPSPHNHSGKKIVF